MCAFKLDRTRLFQPSPPEAVAGSPAQGEWVAADPAPVGEAWGLVQPLAQTLVATPFGQVIRQVHRWRGLVPRSLSPAPGWEAEIDGTRYRVTSALRVMGRLWRLELERQGDR